VHETDEGWQAAYTVTVDRARVDLDVVGWFLTTQAYWGRWRTRSHIERQVQDAWRVVAIHHLGTGAMVGFARAVSDGISMGYLADVFVLAEHRGRGLGRLLVRTMVDDGPGATLRWLLHTADAHGLYAGHGFSAPDSTLLERPRPGPEAEPTARVAPDFAVRTAAAADAGELLTLQRAAFVSEAQVYADPLLPPLTQSLADLVADLASMTFVKAVVAGRIVGTARARDEAGTRHISRLAVAPDQQGRGIGTALVAALEAGAGPEVTAFALFTGADSAANLSLYRHLGYREVRRQALPGGPGLVHLEKRRGPAGSLPQG